ncbi:MAG TPA: hypothetical protein VJA19_13640 [Pseudomonas sp.]|nr:hypothetical protein [Pseudomonas sp.]
MKIVFSSICLIFLAGCVPIPMYKTLQPNAYMKVVDHAGDPIGGAKVELVSSTYPYGFEKFRVAGRTSHGGEIKFTKMKEWRVEVPLMIHGMEVFFWNWCVSKEGYASIQTHHRDADDFDTDALFTLVPGKSETCSDPVSLSGP